MPSVRDCVTRRAPFPVRSRVRLPRAPQTREAPRVAPAALDSRHGRALPEAACGARAALLPLLLASGKDRRDGLWVAPCCPPHYFSSCAAGWPHGFIVRLLLRGSTEAGPAGPAHRRANRLIPRPGGLRLTALAAWSRSARRPGCRRQVTAPVPSVFVLPSLLDLCGPRLYSLPPAPSETTPRRAPKTGHKVPLAWPVGRPQMALLTGRAREFHGRLGSD